MAVLACPEHHSQLATVTVRNDSDGSFHAVHALVTTRAKRIRVHVVECWGASNSPEGEELGRRVINARGDTVSEAIETALTRSREAGMFAELMVSALSQAEDIAEEATLSD